MANIGLYNKDSIFRTFGDELSRFKELSKQIKNSLRVCIPAKIISIDYDKMTCQCQPLIREKLRLASGEYSGVDLPMLLDVPIVYSGSTDYSITFPISIGDEGLVVFADMCIDTWWQSGDVQDQFEVRRHDLSDGFFIPAQMSQVKKYIGIDQQNLEIKNRVTGKGIKIGPNGATFTENVTIPNLTVTGNLNVLGDVNVTGNSFKVLKQKVDRLVSAYNSHTHDAPEGGGTTSGPSGTVS